MNKFDSSAENLTLPYCAWQDLPPPLHAPSQCRQEFMMIRVRLYSHCSNTQSLKMPLSSRSNRTSIAAVPNDLKSGRQKLTRQEGRLQLKTSIIFAGKP
jgi:hypothetical protein